MIDLGKAYYLTWTEIIEKMEMFLQKHYNIDCEKVGIKLENYAEGPPTVFEPAVVLEGENILDQHGIQPFLNDAVRNMHHPDRDTLLRYKEAKDEKVREKMSAVGFEVWTEEAEGEDSVILTSFILFSAAELAAEDEGKMLLPVATCSTGVVFAQAEPSMKVLEAEYNG